MMTMDWKDLEDLTATDLDAMTPEELRDACKQLHYQWKAAIDEAAEAQMEAEEITETASKLEDERTDLRNELAEHEDNDEKLMVANEHYVNLLEQIEDVRRGVADFSELPTESGEDWKWKNA